MQRLGEGRTLVTLDMRGFGRSPWGTGPFSHVGDVLEVLDELALPRVAVAGASFGGSVALDLTLAHPERVSALVLAAPALGGWDWSPDQRAFGAEEDRLLDAGDVEAAVELNVRRWVDAGRPPGEVDSGMRALVADMQRHAFELALAAFSSEPEPGPEQELEPPAAGRLGRDPLPGARRARRARRAGHALDRSAPRAPGWPTSASRPCRVSHTCRAWRRRPPSTRSSRRSWTSTPPDTSQGAQFTHGQGVRRRACRRGGGTPS